MRRISPFVPGMLSIFATVAMSAEIAVGPWHGEGYLDVQANVCYAHMALGPQQDLSFALSCKRHGNLFDGGPVTCASQYNASVTLKRSGWGLDPSAKPAAAVSINDFRVEKLNVAAIATDRLQIKLGPETAIRGAMERSTQLTVDTGTEVLKYPLSKMPELWTALNHCLSTLSDPKNYQPPPPPTPEEAAVAPPFSRDAQSAHGEGSPGLHSCTTEEAFLIAHGSLSHEPTEREREELRAYTDSVSPCIAVWKGRCGYVPLFPSGRTYEMCEIMSSYAIAHVNNRRALENRDQTYLVYNSRAHEIDRIFEEANHSFWASVRKPIDDAKEQQRQDQEARDRQAAARREQDLIDALRRLGSPKAVTTQCTSGIGSVQCISQ